MNSSHLRLMTRDTFAVPITDTEVERMFSKSERIASWSRIRLQAATIREIMLYKNFLVRNDNPLNEKQQRTRQKRKKKRKKTKKKQVSQSVNDDSSESENENEEDSILIK